MDWLSRSIQDLDSPLLLVEKDIVLWGTVVPLLLCSVIVVGIIIVALLRKMKFTPSSLVAMLSQLTEVLMN
jgi:hypothetical protein